MTIADPTAREATYRIDYVSQVHRDLETRIDEELRRPLPNTLTLQRFKRHRLLAKEKLEAWQHLMAAISLADEPSRAA